MGDQERGEWVIKGGGGKGDQRGRGEWVIRRGGNG